MYVEVEKFGTVAPHTCAPETCAPEIRVSTISDLSLGRKSGCHVSFLGSFYSVSTIQMFR